MIFRSHYVRPSRRRSPTQKTLSGHLRHSSTRCLSTSQRAAKLIQRKRRFDRSASVSWYGTDLSPLSQLIQWHAPCLKRREKLGGKKTFSSFINHRSKQPIQWHLARLMLGKPGAITASPTRTLCEPLTWKVVIIEEMGISRNIS